MFVVGEPREQTYFRQDKLSNCSRGYPFILFVYAFIYTKADELKAEQLKKFEETDKNAKKLLGEFEDLLLEAENISGSVFGTSTPLGTTSERPISNQRELHHLRGTYQARL